MLTESTGLRAATLPQLVTLIKKVPDGSIYHHTHDFLFSHQYLAPEPANDFAYWVTEVIGEQALGEELAAVDNLAYATLGELRDALAGVIDRYLERAPAARLRFASEGEEFFFAKSIHIILPTPYSAWTLDEFAQALERIGLRSLYFHVFAARLRLGRPTNDFSKWLDEQLGLKELAREVTQLDPYTHTLETLRAALLNAVRSFAAGRRPFV